MIKIGNNLILDKMDNIDIVNTMKVEQEFYEDNSLYRIKIYYDINKNWNSDVVFKKFINVITEDAIISYFLAEIYYDDSGECQVIYTDDGCGTFNNKIKDLYNIYMMTYKHDDASDGLTVEEIEILKGQLEDE